MTETKTILDFFYDWFYQILNTENSKEIQIIFGEQDSPAPSDHYIVIHRPFAVQQIGSGNWEMSETSGEEGSVLYNYHQQGTMQIEEVGDYGDNIRLVLNSLIRQDIKELFTENNVSILRINSINPNNTNIENTWELRSIVDLIILFPDEGSYDAGYIETVDVNGTYSGTQN